MTREQEARRRARRRRKGWSEARCWWYDLRSAWRRMEQDSAEGL